MDETVAATANGFSINGNGNGNGHGHAGCNVYSNGNGHALLRHVNGTATAPSSNGIGVHQTVPSSNGVGVHQTAVPSANGVGVHQTAVPSSNGVGVHQTAVPSANGVGVHQVPSSNGVGAHWNNGADTKPTAAASFGEGRRRCFWYEEEIEDDLRLCFALNRILHTGVSDYQEIALLDTRPFGKALVIDGKLQSTEVDEFIYHESLVHPALVYHSNPKTAFIMGGGEGSTAREILRHKSMKKVVMCDIDQEVVDFCRKYLVVNREAFSNNRVELIINDARAELENREERFDVIIGDLADPVEGGPCYQLYTKSFYEFVIKPKLNHQGIFVTQAGPAGVLTHTQVFSSIYNTLRQVFKYVVAYSAHVPSFADTWGWVMASDHPLTLEAEEIDSRIKQRVKGELQYLDGQTFVVAATLNKSVRKSLAKETHVYTEETARFIYGHGKASYP